MFKPYQIAAIALSLSTVIYNAQCEEQSVAEQVDNSSAEKEQNNQPESQQNKEQKQNSFSNVGTQKPDNNMEVSAPAYTKLVPVPCWNRYSADSARTLKEWVRWWKYLRAKEPVMMNWINGLKLRIYPKNEIFRAIFVMSEC